MITKLEKKYLWWKKVSYAKQSPSMAKSHELSQQFIQMELSGFNVEPEQEDFISRDNNIYRQNSSIN